MAKHVTPPGQEDSAYLAVFLALKGTKDKIGAGVSSMLVICEVKICLQNNTFDLGVASLVETHLAC